VKNLDDAIDGDKNRNPTLCKFIRCCLHEDNTNIGLSDKDQELLDKLKLLDYMEKKKSISPTSLSNPSRFSTYYKKPTMEIPTIDIDRSQYQDLSERIQPDPSITSNKPNTPSHTKNFDKFNFHSLSTINSSASEKANSNQDSVVSNHVYPSSRKIVQLPGEWWKMVCSNNIQ
jgi:hypothetical protein